MDNSLSRHQKYKDSLRQLRRALSTHSSDSGQFRTTTTSRYPGCVFYWNIMAGNVVAFSNIRGKLFVRSDSRYLQQLMHSKGAVPHSDMTQFREVFHNKGSMTNRFFVDKLVDAVNSIPSDSSIMVDLGPIQNIRRNILSNAHGILEGEVIRQSLATLYNLSNDDDIPRFVRIHS